MHNPYLNSKSLVIGFLLIVGVALGSFFPVLQNDFTNWDDDRLLTDNFFIRGLNRENLQAMFTTPVTKTYTPLTFVTFALEYHFFKYNPFVYHLDNLILHLMVTGLIFLFLQRLGLTTLATWLATLLFAIHPIHVESVAWISERKDVLYAFFYLSALLSYQTYLKKSNRSAFLLTILFGLMSVLSKPMALSLPFILFILDWWYKRQWTIAVFLEKIPHFAYIIPIAWQTYVLHARVPIGDVKEVVPIWIWSFSYYIQKFLVPIQLSPIYHLPLPAGIQNGHYLIALITFIICLFLLIRFRNHRWVCFTFLFYFFSCFFLFRYDRGSDATIVADRFIYLPSLGFCVLIAYWIDQLLKKIKTEGRALNGMTYAILGLLILSLSVKTYFQSQIWKDSLTLWSHVIKLTPDSAIAYNNRADLYIKMGEIQPAIPDLEKAIELDPFYANAFCNRGVVFERLGLLEKAISDYTRSIELDPNEGLPHFNRGNVYLGREQNDLALADYTQAIKKNPQIVGAYHNRAIIRELQGHYAAAIGDLNKAIHLLPDFTDAYWRRSLAYDMLGNKQQALKDARKAQALGFPVEKEYIKNLRPQLQIRKSSSPR